MVNYLGTNSSHYWLYFLLVLLLIGELDYLGTRTSFLEDYHLLGL